jgi:8-amino-7-oxononanoate synthase
VLLGENERALTIAARLCRDGFAVRAIRPPTVPPGTARLRLSLTAKHTTGMIDGQVDSLLRAREEATLLPCQTG